MSRYFVGFDCSSKAVHAVILDEQGSLVSYTKWASSKKTADERFYDVIDQLRGAVRANWNDKQFLAAIELAIYIQNFRTSSAIAQMVTGVKLVLHDFGLAPIMVDNRTWKKTVCGNGRVDKSKIKQVAQERWGTLSGEQDHYDAACIAAYALQVGG